MDQGLRSKEKRVVSRTVSCVKDIPSDIWVLILNNLCSTDIVLSARVSSAFQKLAKESLDLAREKRSILTSKSSLSLEGFRVGPVISPVQGDVAVVFRPETEPGLEVWEISSGQLKAKSEMPPRLRYIVPRELRISNTGSFICIHFDAVILLYALERRAEKAEHYGLHLLHVFQFEVYGRDAEGDGLLNICDKDTRIISAFSKNDDILSVARMERFGLHGAEVSMEFISVGTGLCGYPLGDPNRYPTGTLTDHMNRKRFTSSSPWADLRRIELNASPLRILIPPSLTCESGFVVRPERPLAKEFVQLERRDGRSQILQFSNCGDFLVEANCDKNKGFYKLEILWWDLLSGSLHHQFETVERRKMLQTLLSKDCECAVVLFGEVSTSHCTVSGWNVHLIKTGETLRVRRSKEEMEQQLERYFSISFDGQFIAFVTKKNPSEAAVRVEVHETATGRKASSPIFEIPYSPASNNLNSVLGSSDCSQLVGSGDELSLTSFTIGSQRLGLSYFK